ncbi:TVP38/TMEM64 family protein [Candidatus Woesearchaeota archaeon]|jgi:uncharacterized membrane protein YdjX (TVP38/TMEM64 family)|nr:TVP38/TMEM64 family protein [Candidatus Woesearchaeota archaeon]MBT6518307.1 TVP38/TMEM64 family protein [Candidatus Woesearchaeota archaeon]MBT7367264.1 TVP38/TMEM64 family protein [Candidatus Woesearchaeota archaeon]
MIFKQLMIYLNNKKHLNPRIIEFIVILFVLIVLGILFWKPVVYIFSSSDSIRLYLSNFGILAPLVFILLVIIQVFFAPIPGQIVAFGGGYLFGVFGIIYSMIGLIIGSALAFIFSRRYGRYFVELFVNKKSLKKFDKYLEGKGLFVFFLIFLLPMLPDDLVCFVAGLTNLRIRDLIIVSAIGRFPGFFIATLVGAGMAVFNPIISGIILVVLLILSVLIYCLRHKIENIVLSLTGKLT